MKEPKLAENSELQEMAKNQPQDSQEELMAILLFRKTHFTYWGCNCD
ncbi:hypothetical protein [uncultured Fructobacillus sp.]|nr:hypothetical protein [uncultured Fructobacillus sp.]